MPSVPPTVRRRPVVLAAVVAAAAAWGATATVARATPVLTTLASFNFTNGANPRAGVTLDAAGNLYGTTVNGGANAIGTVYEVAAGTRALTTLVTFAGANGADPQGGLTADAAGNLYGTTEFNYDTGSGSGGTVFRLAAGTRALTTLATFTAATGTGPYAGLRADAAGNLYGTTTDGGANGKGTVFQVAAGTRALTAVASFDGTRPVTPYADLVADAAGNLYGTTVYGGANASGTLFEVAAGTHALTTLVTFAGPNGSGPAGNLAIDAAGNLYGTTFGGGANADGTVFQVAAGTRALTTLVSFAGTNGYNPESGLTLDAAGNLYGTTANGGPSDAAGDSGAGTAFKVAAGTRALTTLATFYGPNGSAPESALTPDAAGTLYGTATMGGPGGSGTVFALTGTGFAVPEPAAASLFAAAGSALLGRRRRAAGPPTSRGPRPPGRR